MRTHVPPVFPRKRRGFSLPEMLIVLLISGLVMRVALPRFSGMRDKMALRSAKQQIGAYLVTTRAAAIRQSQRSRLIISGSTIRATMNQSVGAPVSITGKVPLDRSGVALTMRPPTDSIAYDPRGLATYPDRLEIFILTRNGVKDSLCVSKLGLIARRCGQ